MARWAPRDLSQLTYSDGKQFTRNISATSYRSPAMAPPLADVNAIQSPAVEADLSLHKQWSFLQSASLEGYSSTTLLNMNGSTVPGDATYAPGSAYAPDNVVSDAEAYYFDEDHDGRMRDDELDEDGDGLGNYDEAHGYMQPSWWSGWYSAEVPYTIPYAGTRLDDADSDGDGVIDGADDQDHDDYPNVVELSRRLAAGEDQTQPKWTVGTDPQTIHWNRNLENPLNPPTPANPQPFRAMVDPFNPCEPDVHSRTCPVRIPANAWAPFSTQPTDTFHVFN